MDHFGESADADAGRTDLATIQILVLHGGEWVDNPGGIKTYSSSKPTEIMLLPKDCNYRNLADMVNTFFNLNPTQHRVTMTYGVKTSIGIVILHIRNDTDVQHFLRFNTRADTTTPLCLLIDGEPYDFPLQSDQDQQPLVGSNPCFSMHAHGSSKGSTHVPENPDVPAQGVLVEEVRGNEDVEQYEFSVHCSSNDNGPGEEHFIDEDDVLLPNAQIDAPKNDYNDDILSAVNRNGVVFGEDFRGCVGPNTGINIGTSSMVIEKNQLFSNKKELRHHVSLYAVTHNFEFKVYRSTTQLFVARCVIESCKWRLRAVKIRNSDYFRVSKATLAHSCPRDPIHHDHRQASSRLIGHCIKSMYEGVGSSYKPKDIIDDVRKEFGVNISYDKAWRARECALDSIRGSLKESYAILPSYCTMLELKNPGSVTAIHTDETNHFKYFFMSIGACIRGFHNSIRPVIAITGISLNAKYLKTLFIAVSMDGNDQVYPIAFGISDSENDTSWEWFMMKLKEVIYEVEGLVIVSNLNNSIEKAIKKALPHAIHGICIDHLSHNLKSMFKNKALIPLFNMTAKVSCPLEFSKMMKEITKCDVNAAKYLTDVGVERWARAHFNSRRYNITTTIIVECFNEISKNVKELQIPMLIDHLRSLLQNWFYERRTKAADMKCVLANWAECEVHRRIEISARYHVCPIDCYKMEVFDGDRKSLVNLHDKSCSCREFDLDQLPCAHALAAARYCHISANDLCSHFYTTTCLVAAYAESIYPVGHRVDWDIPDEISQRVVLPPLTNQSSEKRRRKQRIATSKDRQMRKCGRCQGIGHNRQTCEEPIPFHPREGAASS